MPSHDLHGNAPDTSPVVLLLIDFINDLEFPEGAQFLKPTKSGFVREYDGLRWVG